MFARAPHWGGQSQAGEGLPSGYLLLVGDGDIIYLHTEHKASFGTLCQ